MARGAGLWVGLNVAWIPLAFLLDGVTVLILPLRLGVDATSLGLVSLVGLGIAAGLQPPVGWLSDRVRGRIARKTFLAAAAAPAIVGLWLLIGTSTLVGAVAGYVLIQAAASSMQAAQQTLIPEQLDPAQQGRGSGLKTAFDVGGSFLAFLVLGAVLGSGDLPSAGLVITVVVLVAVGMVVRLVPTRPAAPTERRARSRLPEGLGALIIARFLFLFATYGVGRFLVMLVAERLGLDPSGAASQAGGLLALFTLATAAASLPIGWLTDRRPRRHVMAAGGVIAAVGIGILVPPAGMPGIVLGGLLMAVGTAAFVTANWAATTTLAAPRDAGRLMAIANLGTGLAAAAAGTLGLMIDVAGFPPALLLAGVTSMAAVIPILGHPTPIGNPRENLA